MSMISLKLIPMIHLSPKLPQPRPPRISFLILILVSIVFDKYNNKKSKK